MGGYKKKKSQCEWQNLWESQTVLAKMDIFFVQKMSKIAKPIPNTLKNIVVTDFITNMFFGSFFCEHNFFLIFLGDFYTILGFGI